MWESTLNWFESNSAMLQKAGTLWFVVGILSLAVTLIALPIIILQLPADYFVRGRRLRLLSTTTHPVIGIFLLALKNLLGATLFILGAVMLFIPGQGILTMLIGLMLMNFPGKFALEQKLVRRASVLRVLNRVRSRWGKDPLLPPIASGG